MNFAFIIETYYLKIFWNYTYIKLFKTQNLFCLLSDNWQVQTPTSIFDKIVLLTLKIPSEKYCLPEIVGRYQREIKTFFILKSINSFSPLLKPLNVTNLKSVTNIFRLYDQSRDLFLKLFECRKDITKLKFYRYRLDRFLDSEGKEESIGSTIMSIFYFC